jgi:hypothetical protein
LPSPTSDHDRSTSMRPGLAVHATVLALLAIASFLATAALVRALVPWPAEGALSARIQHFLAHADEYDLLFLGSSNAAHGFDPAVVDAELVRRGHPFRSYSLAAEDMQPVEADFVLREVLRRQPARLRWVAIELLDFEPTAVIRDNAFSERAVYWHDARSLCDALARLLQSAAPWSEKARLSWLHLRHAAWRLGNLGEGDRVVAAWRETRDPVVSAVVGAGGFEALDDRSDPATLRMRAAFLANQPRYRARVEGLDAQNERPSAPASVLIDGVVKQTTRLRAAGIEPVYVIPPVLHATPALHAFAASPGAPPIFCFNAPGRHPELFRFESRYDETHVNRAGSEVLSHEFADALATLLDGKRTP